MKNNGDAADFCYKHLGVQGRSKNARKVGGEGTADAGNG